MLTLIAIALATDWSLSDAPVDRNQAVVIWSLTDTQDQKGGDPSSGFVQPAEPVTDDLHLTDSPPDWPAGVSIEFWGASWCGYCPATKKAAEEAAGSVDYHDYDSEKTEANKLGVTTLPTMYLMKDGKRVKTLTGSFGKSSILKLAKEVAGESWQGQTIHTSGIARSESGRVTMRWNFDGNWNPTTSQMISHLAEHGIDAEGMTRQQMANAHDAAHGSGLVTQYVNRSQPVRLISRGAGCPNGRCPR